MRSGGRDQPRKLGQLNAGSPWRAAHIRVPTPIRDMPRRLRHAAQASGARYLPDWRDHRSHSAKPVPPLSQAWTAAPIRSHSSRSW